MRPKKDKINVLKEKTKNGTKNGGRKVKIRRYKEKHSKNTITQKEVK